MGGLPTYVRLDDYFILALGRAAHIPNTALSPYPHLCSQLYLIGAGHHSVPEEQ